MLLKYKILTCASMYIQQTICVTEGARFRDYPSMSHKVAAPCYII